MIPTIPRGLSYRTPHSLSSLGQPRTAAELLRAGDTASDLGPEALKAVGTAVAIAGVTTVASAVAGGVIAHRVADRNKGWWAAGGAAGGYVAGRALGAAAATAYLASRAVDLAREGGG